MAARHARKFSMASVGWSFASNGSARARRNSADCLASAAAACLLILLDARHLFLDASAI
ncbi:hypothetical protein ACVOMV_33890 [Mesorhizobium atlanticum]